MKQESNQALESAVERLSEVSRKFASREISALEHSRSREAAIASGLMALAESFDVKLRSPLHIDSRGEFMLVALDGNKDPRLGTGQFGPGLVAELNQHSPRTGVMPGMLDPLNGWCLINHFSAESLVRRVAAAEVPHDQPGRPRGA